MKLRRILSLFPILSVVWLLCPSTASAYLGPGAGFAVAGSFFAVFIAILAAVGAILGWPLRWVARRIRRRGLGPSLIRRLIVIGLDGMDPRAAKTLMNQGRLPNMAALAQQGSFSPLGTTRPPVSPAAWASFSTGVSPGKHGIYDFLSRNPQTYGPELSSVRTESPNRDRKSGWLGFRWGGPEIRGLKRSRSFWSLLGERGISCTTLRVPISYPPEKFRGRMLSAMCAPDIRGTQGTFTYFHDEDAPPPSPFRVGQSVPASRQGEIRTFRLEGPPDHRDPNGGALSIALKVQPSDAGVVVSWKGGRVELMERSYSDWIRFAFGSFPNRRIRAVGRFYLMSRNPIKLYLTPLHIDPARPALPISHPGVYAPYLAGKFGSFATLGLSEDTWALEDEAIDEAAFAQQCRLIQEEREAIFMDALARHRSGCLTSVFDITDRMQHMFWTEAKEEGDEFPNQTIATLYEEMDALVGRVLARCDEKRDAILIVSDHGFSAFDYGLNLNSWLRDNGYLKLKENAGEVGWLEAVDWANTRAYGFGLNGLYLNLKGRERLGVVNPGEEAEKLLTELAERLEALNHNEAQTLPVKRAIASREIQPGPYVERGPDLFVELKRGYRVSWDSVAGEFPEAIFEPNVRKWKGDHCIAPELAPGTFISNLALEGSKVHLIDMAPSILRLFGVPIPSYMEGRALLRKP